MNPLGVCSKISAPCAPALTINYFFSKQRLPRPMRPPRPTRLGVQGGKENRRKETKLSFFQDLFKDWIVLFSPSFFKGMAPSSISLGSFGAKLCQQRVPSPCAEALAPPRRTHYVPHPRPGAPQPPQLSERLVSIQLFAQSLIPALVNPGSVYGEQPEWCHLGLL